MSRIDQLKRFSDLKNAGALSEEEFAREKTLILNAPVSSPKRKKSFILAVVCIICVLTAGAVYFSRRGASIAPVVSTPALSVAQQSKPRPASSGATSELPKTPPLTEVGQCKSTSIASIGTRLEGTPASGTTVNYTDGTYGVSYDTIADAEASRVGDPIKLCLTELPKNCPVGDDRGKVYSAENLRSGGKWSLPDSEHECGGA